MFKNINTLQLFFEEPAREFNVREVARLIKVAPATASKQLSSLAKSNILQEREERRFKLYKANLNSEHYKDLKIYYNIRKIRESGLLAALDNFYLRPAVVLFGAASHGLDTETSDFDLLVISEKTQEFAENKKFEKILGRPLQIFVFKNIKDIKNKHLLNNMLNGIVLQGEVKWI